MFVYKHMQHDGILTVTALYVYFVYAEALYSFLYLQVNRIFYFKFIEYMYTV